LEDELSGVAGGDREDPEVSDWERLSLMGGGVGSSITLLLFSAFSSLAKSSVKLSTISLKPFLSREAVSCNEPPFWYSFSDVWTRFCNKIIKNKEQKTAQHYTP
jgi:hypothetical protein